MIVRLYEGAVPAVPGAGDILLAQVFAFGRAGRFGVVAANPGPDGLNAALREWLGRRGPFEQEAFRTVLRAGLRRPRYGGLAVRELAVHLGVEGRAAWEVFGAHDVALPLTDEALDWLGSPRRAYLENGRTDWSFLRKVAPSAWRGKLERAILSGWLEEHGVGGITELAQVLDQVIANELKVYLRSWVLFDSDADGPGARSKAASDLGELCEATPVAFHCLERRAVENYVPKRARWGWVESDPAKAEVRRAWMRAFESMPTDLHRHHLHMKEGLEKDNGLTRSGQRKTPSAQHLALFGPLCSDTSSPLWVGALSGGGSGELAEVWRAEWWIVDEEDLDRDGSRPEREALMQTLFTVL